MEVKDFDYELPKELIAQDPLEDRSSSRLMVLNKLTGETEDKVFTDILQYLKPGDTLVINDTKVIPARLLGLKEDTGAHVEILLLKRMEGDVWECLVRPGKKLRPGARVVFGDGLLVAEIFEVVAGGNRLVRFTYEGIFEEVLDQLGEMPLPPYITHKLQDKNRYQTVYATHEGSAAAPTAGLHFTPELLKQIEDMGVNIARVTLHVGLGTFRPVKETTVEDHEMHAEFYIVKDEIADLINKTVAEGRRVVAVGTTSARTLESAGVLNEEYERLEALAGEADTVIADGIEYHREPLHGTNKFISADGKIVPKYVLKGGSAWTSIFIYPGYEWKLVNCMITNFHLPQSTLVMMVSSLCSREFILNAYQHAIDLRYRFFSFGDAMFIQQD